MFMFVYSVSDCHTGCVVAFINLIVYFNEYLRAVLTRILSDTLLCGRLWAREERVIILHRMCHGESDNGTAIRYTGNPTARRMDKGCLPVEWEKLKSSQKYCTAHTLSSYLWCYDVFFSYFVFIALYHAMHIKMIFETDDWIIQVQSGCFLVFITQFVTYGGPSGIWGLKYAYMKRDLRPHESENRLPVVASTV